MQRVLNELQLLNGRFDVMENERRQQKEAETGIRVERNSFPINEPTAFQEMEERLANEQFYNSMVFFFVTTNDPLIQGIY